MQRGITYQQIWETYKFPDEQIGSKNAAVERIKKFGEYSVSIIYKHNERNEVVVLSCWMDPPLPGSTDAKEKEWWRKYKKSSFFGKFWLIFKKQVGI